ncbi:hypothetical protein LTR36_001271 [Oleoguttula mirabilis]|uniref:Uncharacterized protein n=1 Tax=Oleoguttula mirabilis TaxID=1507867 RepID=A0AAV9JPD7_9PEZI|nr:hypothetical protein LTR36_001271 [Oleoguttula mirabilis]
MTSTPNKTLDAEKTAAGLTFAVPHPRGGGHASHQHVAKAKEKIRHFLHPDGKRIHVASSPEEAIHLRHKLAQLHKDEDFDVCVSGTPEHLDAVRQAREHHEGRRDELRSQHKDVYERFADVTAELDMLSNELERVTTHGVSLEAHFNKYGYNAHIKSYDDESPSESGASTPRSSIDAGKRKDSEVEQGYATPLKLFQMPAVRQYFHKGILWRASGSEEVQSFELFIDLLYVGIIAINGDAASENPTSLALLQFIITFTLSWKIWNDMALIISWFETNDIFQRISILFLLACLFGFTTTITQAFGQTYATLIGFYLASRLYMAIYLLAMAFIIPMIRPVMIYQVVFVGIGTALWIASIHVSWPNQLALIWVALWVDVAGAFSYVYFMMICHKIGGRAKEWFDNTFEFYPAINIEHRTERMNAFVTLVFGYTVVAILYQSTRNGVGAFFGKAILGLIQAFCFNWIYFEIDGANLRLHAIRRHKASAMLWNFSHLPFIMAFVLAGGALARLVVATDTPQSRLEDLTEAYQVRSEPEIRAGIRWFYCAGLAIALGGMGLISISHVHKEVEGLRLKKRHRLTFRFSVVVILACLPLADGLDSLQLVGTVTGLVVLTLVTELWATSSCHEKLMERSKPCQYFGHCGKKNLEAYVKDGREVDVAELGSEKVKKSGITIGL